MKLILGLIWSLIAHYQLGASNFPPKKLMLAWLKVGPRYSTYRVSDQLVLSYASFYLKAHSRQTRKFFLQVSFQVSFEPLDPYRVEAKTKAEILYFQIHFVANILK